mmetsp:Transcript_13231/g.35837  ORF Transcript_13231/g.35837 Transcript_13231/m.35837 type:complete len:202 (-) Transcript_13231:7-612(-)
MADSAPMRLLTSETSDCRNAAGFLDISFSMTPMARVRASTVSISVASSVSKSDASFSRISVASFSSFSDVPILAARSSILPVLASMSAAALLMVASSFPCMAFAVLISYCCCLVVSSHHSKYSWYAFSSASPSAVTLPSSEVSSSTTLPRGSTWAARARSARAAARSAAKAPRHCIAVIVSSREEANTEIEAVALPSCQTA